MPFVTATELHITLASTNYGHRKLLEAPETGVLAEHQPMRLSMCWTLNPCKIHQMDVRLRTNVRASQQPKLVSLNNTSRRVIGGKLSR